MTNLFYYNDIVQINSNGIVCANSKDKIIVSFSECVKNYIRETSLDLNQPEEQMKTCVCLGTRDVTKWMFTFYSKPKTIIVIKSISRWERFFKGDIAYRQFSNLQNKIFELGYTTLDLS